MPIVQNTAAGVVVIPTAGPPGVSITGPAGPQGEGGPQGDRGPPGPQGVAGAGAVKTRTASEVVPSWCAVVGSGGGLCSPAILGADPTTPPQIIGICATGGAVDSVVSLQSQGDLSGPSASWSPGDTLYVDPNGSLTTTAPTTGWLVRVGIVASQTQIVITNLDAEWITPLITLDAISAILTQALTDVVASLSLTPPALPGLLWRSQTFTALSPNLDGTPYTAPYGAGLSGAVDPVTALLPIAVPRALRGLPTEPPAAPGALWRNGVRLALTPASDGSAYPTTPLPTTGAPLLIATRTALAPWLASTMPALPPLPPLSSGVLWRSADHSLSLSL